MLSKKKLYINGETLSYLDNEVDSTTLLFIHGAFIKKEYWRKQLSFFSKSYRVVALDLAGHGESSKRRKQWSVENYGEDLLVFIDKLRLKKVVLVGHSFGADIMIETTLRSPSEIKELIGIDHFKNIDAELPPDAMKSLIEGLESDFYTTCERYARQSLLNEKASVKLVSKILGDFKVMDRAAGISIFKENIHYASRRIDHLKKLPIVLNLIHVDYTPTNEETLARYLSDHYKLYILRGTSHYPMIEIPNALNACIDGIIQTI